MHSLLLPVAPMDVTAIVAAVIGLALVAAVAGLIPALRRRASIRSLRYVTNDSSRAGN